MESSGLLSLLRPKHVSAYLIQWIGSFLRDRTCRLAFQGSPCTFTPVSVSVPQGSPISPLLFVIYVSSLYTYIPNGLTISYVDDFANIVASPSYRTNVRPLQTAFSTLTRRATPGNISFSVPKTELMHWRTPRETQPPCHLPMHLEGQVFYSQNSLKWLGFLFIQSFDPRAHFSCRLSLANAAFATIRRLSPPGVGLPLHLCLTLAWSLLTQILLYGSTVWHPPPTIMDQCLSSGNGFAGGQQTAFLLQTQYVSIGRHASPSFPDWSATSGALQALGSYASYQKSTRLQVVSQRLYPPFPLSGLLFSPSRRSPTNLTYSSTCLGTVLQTRTGTPGTDIMCFPPWHS